MNTTEHIANTPIVTTGRFALLGALLRANGTGAPAPARRRVRLGLLASLCALTGALALAASPALAARGHVFGSAFGAPGTGNGQFKEPSGVAVNEATGGVYVVDKGNNRVEYFSAAGAYEGQFNGSGLLPNEGLIKPPAPLEKPESIAVDNACGLHKPVALTGAACEAFDPSNGDVYVADKGHVVIDKFSAGGEYLSQFTGLASGSFAKNTSDEIAVAVDAGGGVWVNGEIPLSNGETRVTNWSSASPNVFVASRGYQAPGSFAWSGLAVDSTGAFYIREGLRDAEATVVKHDSSGARLYPVDNEPSTAVTVELSSNDGYVDNITSVGVFGADGTPLERFGTGQLAAGSGIGVDSVSQTAYVADSSANVVDVYPPEPPSAPSVESGSFSNVASTSATFSAQINPRGASTEYHFEYGPTTAYGTSLPVFDIGSPMDFETREVGAHLQGLSPSTAYHLRVVASNEIAGKVETTFGPDETFTTQTLGGEFVLPDGRAWELVSPPNKHGALIEPIGERGLIQAAADGGAFTYFTDAPTESEPRGFSNNVQVFSVRGPGGWSSQDISPPHNTSGGPATGKGLEYRFFSNDLSRGILEPQGEFTPLSGEETSPEATEQTQYVRKDFACQTSPATCYTPLVTSANTPPHTKLDSEAGVLQGKAVFVGSTPDASHVVLLSFVALTETSLPPVNGAPGWGLYEWTAGKLALASMLEGEAAVGPKLGSQEGVAARNAISTDGARVVWSAQGLDEEHLYLRDMVMGKTVQLDTVQVGGSTTQQAGGGPQFQLASSDGSRVFFTDTQRLTEDAGAVANEPDLYECEMVEPLAGELECKLTDLTPLVHSEHAAVQGAVLGASEDRSWVYFVANGVFAQGATPGKCKFPTSEPGATCNLYVGHDGTTRLVAVLSGKDMQDWSSDLKRLTARVSPDGRWLAFMSQRSLTGYDNRDALSGKPDEEVYLYDAQAEHLVCASCNPTGGRPVGVEYRHLNGQAVGGDRVWEANTWLAANIPGWTPYSRETLYQSRYLSDSGRLFFNSSDALVPQDANATEDVYQYEPPGVPEGSSRQCTTESATFSARSGGCVSLISSGGSGQESAFLDAGEMGGDVFFLTTAKLAPQDFDTSLDVYDAHECTEASPCFPAPAAQPPPCGTGDSCKPAPSPQPAIFGAPPSAMFSAAGTASAPGFTPALKPKSLTRAQKLAQALKACRKKRNRGQRVTCERKARKQFGPVKSSKANATKKGRG